MRAFLASFALLLLAACGEDAPPSNSGMKVKFEGQTIDVGEMQAAGERAKAMMDRPLTSADVEKYLAILPEITRLGANQADSAKVLETHGVKIIEWSALLGRVSAAYAALKLPQGSHTDKAKADAAVVRPFLDRLDTAMKAK